MSSAAFIFSRAASLAQAKPRLYRATMNIGTKIRRARIAANLSQGGLGKLIGVTPQAISQWENEKSDPTSANVRAIATALRIPVSLLTDESQPDTPARSSAASNAASYRDLSAEDAEAIGRATVRYLVEHADEDTANRWIDLLLEVIKPKATDAGEALMQSLRSQAQASNALLKVVRRPKIPKKP